AHHALALPQQRRDGFDPEAPAGGQAVVLVLTMDDVDHALLDQVLEDRGHQRTRRTVAPDDGDDARVAHDDVMKPTMRRFTSSGFSRWRKWLRPSKISTSEPGAKKRSTSSNSSTP